MNEVEHSDYPHWPGMLYDCPACMAECFCDGLDMQCVHCEEDGYVEAETIQEASHNIAEEGYVWPDAVREMFN